MYAEHTAESISIFRSSGQLLIKQHAEQDKRPFIHPIQTPSGNGTLTENEPEHHPWQHGLYVGLNQVNGVGFWTEGLVGLPQEGTFHPNALQPPVLHEHTAQWSVATDWRDHEGNSMLFETQRWEFTDHGDHYILDLNWSLQAKINLEFGEYPYGGLFLRMPFRAEHGGTVLNSEGSEGLDAEAQRSRWVAVSMPLVRDAESTSSSHASADHWGGIAIMDHPTNPEHPVPWRVDDQLGIGPGRSIAGAWRLAARATEHFKHRLYVFEGKLNTSNIEKQWQQFI